MADALQTAEAAEFAGIAIIYNSELAELNLRIKAKQDILDALADRGASYARTRYDAHNTISKH